MNVVQESRWDLAQEAEKEFWKTKYPNNSLLILKKKYFDKAKFILDECKKFIPLNKNTRILQVGCAALDAINYINVGKKYALDPLADFYKENFEIDYSNINFKKGVGEKIPYKDNYFDIIILANVLDHVMNPEKVLSEIYRVLKKNGLLYIETDISTPSFILIYNSWKNLNNFFGKTFNKPHPHIFSQQDIDFLLGNNFNQLKKFDFFQYKQKFILRILNYFGISTNMFFRALYSKKPEVSYQ